MLRRVVDLFLLLERAMWLFSKGSNVEDDLVLLNVVYLEKKK
jgi:hypothetical protein